MAIDFSRYQVGGNKQPSDKIEGSQIGGSQIDFSRYAVTDYTPTQVSQPQQTETTRVYEEQKQERKGLLEKTRGFFQDFGYKRQQGTDVFTKTGEAVQKAKDWAVGSDQEVIQRQKEDLVQKIADKQSRGKDTREEELQLRMIAKIEDPNVDEATKKQNIQYIRLSRFAQTVQSSAGNFFSGLMGISRQQEEAEAQRQLNLYNNLLEGKDPNDKRNLFLVQERDYWQNVVDGGKTRSEEAIEKIDQWVDDVDVANPTNAEKLSNATGSMAVFAITSYATGGSADVPLLLEALGEAGSVYNTLRDEGRTIEESGNRSNTALVANLIIGKFLNIFDDLGTDKGVKAIIKGIGTEGGQEGSQQIISNLATDRPIEEGVVESVVIGGILGGTTVVVFPSPAEVTSPAIPTNPDEYIKEIVNTDFAKTAEGKQMLKIALEAKEQGKAINVGFTQEGKVEITISEKSLSEALNEAVVRPQDRVASTQTTATTGTATQQTQTKQQAQQAQAVARVVSQKYTQEQQVEEQKVYRGSRGKVVEQNISFGNVLVVPKDQYDLMLKLAEAGNQDAMAYVESLPEGVKRVDYTVSDQIIREAFRNQYDAIQYNNEQLKAKGKEWHDLKSNQFYSSEKLTAEQYAKQKRGGKYAKKVQEAPGVPGRSQEGRPRTQEEVAKSQAEKVVKTKSKSQVRHDKINEYINNRKTVKFREGDISTVEDVEKSAVTSKFLLDPQIKGRDTASYSFLDNYSRSNKLGLKPKEQAIIKRVLDQHFLNQKNIDMKEFKRLVIGELLPINTIQSSTYADYGSDNININADATTTYILDTPFKHGQAGHFNSDYTTKLTKEDVEIREIPAQENNPSAKWAVLQKGVTLTEQNIQENVFTVATSKENAQKWIDEHTELSTGQLRVEGKSGLFSHYRAFDVGETSHIAEIQSDAFQHLEKIDGTLELKQQLRYTKDQLKQSQEYLERIEQQQERAKARKDQEKVDDLQQLIDGEKDSIQGREINIKTLEERLERFSEVGKEEAQFLDYKNIWHERTVREAIRTKALEGFEKIRFPTPRTIAFIEGYTSEDGGMPYEIIEGDQDQLKPGDTIDYGGEEMTVVEADNYQITVAPSDKVNSFSNQQFIEEGINAQWEDVKYNIDGYTEVFGEIDSKEKVEDIKKAVEVLDKIARFNHKEAKIKSLQDAFKVSFEDMYADVSKNIENRIEKFREFETALKDGSFVEKTDVSYEGIFYGTQKQWIEDKYGLESGWVRRNQTGELISKEAQNDPKEFRKVLAKQLVEGIPETIKSEEYVLEQHKKRLETERKNYDNLIDEEQKRKMPTKKEMDVLKRFPKSSQEIIDELGNLSQYGLDYDVQEMFDWMDDNGNYSIDDYEEHWFDETSENYEPDYDGIYQEVYYDEGYGGNDTTVYGVDGYAETFQQPDEYEPGAGIEDFNIEDFDSTQQVVLRFYEKQLNKYIKKLRKGNLELVEDENGFEWWETEVRPEDKEATVAFRLKDDLADVGINITDAQEQELIKLNREIFGDDNIKITSQILANNKALGAYSQKMIEIMSKQANPKDTFFHEAVHKYIDVFTTKDEQFSLFEEGMKRYRTEDLALVEEKIAEDFIKYANNARSIKGIIARFFKKIFSRIRAFNKNASKIEKLYEEILSGKAKETVAGQTKASKVAVSIEQNLNERFENLAGFETRTVKSQAEMVSKLIAKDIEQVKKIVTGAEPLPAGMSGSMFIAGVEKYATDNNDIDLIRSLAISPLVSETSVNAQELRFLAERDKTSVLAQVQELASERAKIFKSKHKNTTPEKAIKQEVKKIKKSTNKVSKYDWNEFINSIEC